MFSDTGRLRIDRSWSFNSLALALMVLFAPCVMFHLTSGSMLRLRRDCVDSGSLRGVKLQLPPLRPESFTTDQGMLEDKEQGMSTVEDEYEV